MRKSGHGNSKVRAYRQPIKLNAGLIVFIFIFIYISIYIIVYLTKQHIAIYEVVEKSISENNEFTGIAIRDEEVAKTKEAGYITYYVSNSARVAVNDLVFSVDEGASAYETLEKSGDKQELSEKDYMILREKLLYYKKGSSEGDFGKLYDFKNELKNLVLEMNTGVIFDNLEELVSKVGEDKLVINKTKESGVVSLCVDGMEDTQIEDIDATSFSKMLYTKEDNYTGKLLEKDEGAYRLAKSEEWDVIVKLNQEQYDRIKDFDDSRIGVTFLEKELKTSANVRAYVKAGSYFADLTFDKYMVDFVDERYIDLELEFDSAKGLKIPNTSITEKEFYLVPLQVFTRGGDSDDIGLLSVYYSNKGQRKTKFQPTSIYCIKNRETKEQVLLSSIDWKGTDKLTELVAYVDKNQYTLGTQILDPDKNKIYSLSESDKLKGVYNVNKGYCEFRWVDVLYKNQEYSIVNSGSESEYMLSKFDHIVLDVSVAKEQKIIY